ncbi:MAG: Sapep family Mn(2+)-dependent dipeptidase [Fimbriimonadaceae bacterium]
MTPDEVSRIQSWIDEHEKDLLDATVSMLQIPSLESEPEPNAPFGRECRRALDQALQHCENWGWRTKDLDGYGGYAEFGEGEKMVAVFGHLDVVPTGHGWSYPPFGAEIHDGYIYARGAVDDKGPTMAALYALRAIEQVGAPAGTRFRIFFGCNEESGFKCIDHYSKVEEQPTFGIAPDSGWPLYHAEKGIADVMVSCALPAGDFALKEMHGGSRPNIVIDECDAVVHVARIHRPTVEVALAKLWDRNVSAKWVGDDLHLKCIGKAAHGATPFLGDSAASRLLRVLVYLAPPDQREEYIELLLATHPSGPGIGIHGGDEPSGDLTANLGIVETRGGRLHMLFNVRYPVTWNLPEILERMQSRFRRLEMDWKIEDSNDNKPLYFPLEHPMVKTICDVVRAETGVDRAPGVMGGGTYARAVENTVSVGTGWEGDGQAHQVDERLKVAHLSKMARIYGRMLYELALLPAPKELTSQKS